MKSRVKPAMATRARRTLGRSQRGLLERHRAVEQKEPTKSWANIANETGRFDLAAPLTAPHVLPECAACWPMSSSPLPFGEKREERGERREERGDETWS